MKSFLRAILIILICWIPLVACTRPDQEQPAVSLEAPTAEPAVTPSAQVEAAATTPQQDCIDDATFLQDLTVPDGSQVSPGEQIDKRWSVENSGSCDWGIGYRLIPQDPNPLVSGRESALYPAQAGSSAVWRITFEAPQEAGEYIGSWQAYNPEGQPFGDPVFVLIEVVGAQATSSP